MSVKGARIFNLLPASLRNKESDFDLFQYHLDIFLSGVPDQPTMPGLALAALQFARFAAPSINIFKLILFKLWWDHTLGWEPIADLRGSLLHSNITPTPPIHFQPGWEPIAVLLGFLLHSSLTPTPSNHPSPAGVGTHSSAMGRFSPEQPHSHPIIHIIINYLQPWWDQTLWTGGSGGLTTATPNGAVGCEGFRG